MKIKKPLFYISFALAVIAAAWWFSRQEPPAVKLHTVARGAVESSVANTRTGTVSACRRSHIVPVMSGQVEKVLVKEGDQVRSGQLLIELWNEDISARVALARSEVGAARARAEEACVRADLARRESERQGSLKQRGLASEDSYDKALNAARTSAAACKAGEASVEVARAQIQVAQAELERTLLRAPFAGIVAEINAEAGEVLAPLTAAGDFAAAVDLIEGGCLYISAPIDEIDAPAISPGMAAHITLDAFPGTRFPGKVRRIAPYVLDIEKQARTVEVEVEITPQDMKHTLLPGYSADVEVVLDRREDVLWIPGAALLQGNHVWVYGEADGRLQKRGIRTGLSNWQTTEVVEGLDAGDRIVISVDTPGLEEGVVVKPQPNDERP